MHFINHNLKIKQTDGETKMDSWLIEFLSAGFKKESCEQCWVTVD